MSITEEQTHQLRSGTVLNGKYKIEIVLGEGGFGITYRALDTTLDLTVAIKEYYPAGCVTRETTSTNTVTAFTGDKQDIYNTGREKFIREARTMGKLSGQRGIVSVRDYFQENNTAYIVMEFLDGITLKEYLKQAGGKIGADEALELIKPVVKSLAEVHKQGLIHRDISPDNIMVMPDGQVKLLDFGAARNVSLNGEKSLSVMLKPGYAPEEQYRTRGEQGPWSDIYALCATVYRCITGQIPLEAMERIRRDELPAPSALGIAIDKEREAVLMKGLAVFSEDRIQSAEELYKAWYGEAVQMIGKGNAVKASEQKPEGRKRLVLLLSAGVTAMVLLIGVVTFIVMHGTGEMAKSPGDIYYSSGFVTSDGDILYLRQRDGVVMGYLDRESGIREADVLLSDLQMGSLLAPRDSYVYMVFPQIGLIRFNLKMTNGVEYLTEDAVEDGFLVADEHIYYVKSKDRFLYRAKTDGSEEERLTDFGVPVNAFTLYDRMLWFYTEDKERGIYVKNFDTGDTQYVDNSGEIGEIACLRSGKQVIYAVTEKGEIYTINPGTGKLSDNCGQGVSDSLPIIPIETKTEAGFLYLDNSNEIYFWDSCGNNEEGVLVYRPESTLDILLLECVENRVYFVTEDGVYHCFDLPKDDKLIDQTMEMAILDLDRSLNYYDQSLLAIKDGGVEPTDGEKELVKQDDVLPEESTDTIGEREESGAETEENPGATSNPETTPKPTITPKAEATPKPTATPKAETTPKPTATPKAETTPKPTATPKPTSAPTPTPAAHTHSYTASVTQNATCVANGVKTYTCSCGNSYTESISATGHNYQLKSTTAATCKSEGREHYCCANCGDTYDITLAKTSHSFDTNTTTAYPTCETPGERVYTCSICGETKTETLPARGHSWQTVEYTYNGVKITEVKCSNFIGAWPNGYMCGAVLSHTETPIESEGGE